MLKMDKMMTGYDCPNGCKFCVLKIISEFIKLQVPVPIASDLAVDLNF